jgi:hypothetical protein
VTKARACKVVGQKGSPGVPFWELESQWTFESLEGNCRGQNPSIQRVFYIIEKLLEHKCLKSTHMTHFDIWNTSYGQKKNRVYGLRFDSRPLKVANRPNFLACRCPTTYRWKALDEGYNFSSNLIGIRGLNTKLWVPKVVRIPLGSPRTKCHLDVGLVERHKI